MRDKPTHKQCRQCGEWFSLKPRAGVRQKFCTVSCSAFYRTSQPKWKREQSRKIKAITDPEVMREKSRAMWRDPEMRAHLTEATRQRANSDEHRARMEKHNEKLWADPEFRERHVERTRKATTELWADPAFREKITKASSEATKQRWADADYRDRVSRNIRIAKKDVLVQRRQSEASKEAANRPEAKARTSARMKARWADPETAALMAQRSSETAKRKWRDDPVYRAKRLKVLAKAAKSPESRARMSELNKKRWADPEYRERMRKRSSEMLAALNKKRWADPVFKARVAAKISAAKRKRR